MFYVYYFKNITCTVVQMYLNESLIIIIFNIHAHLNTCMCIFIYFLFLVNFNS
jgi:hypothetical protein